MLAFVRMSPPGGTKRGHEDEAAPVTKSVRRPSTRRKTLQKVQLPAWIGAACSVASLVVAVIALVRVSSSDAVKTAVEVNSLRKDMDVVLKWIRLRDGTFPAAKTIVPPGPNDVPTTDDSSSPMKKLPPGMMNPDLSRPPNAPPSVSASATASAQPTPSAPALQESRKPTPTKSAPDCVHRGTMKKMACELQVRGTCLGLGDYTPERYRDIRLAAGVGEYMLVCDSVNDPPKPAPSAGSGAP